MPPDPDAHRADCDPAGTGVSLAAEAALLEARLRMLRAEIGRVDARIEADSEALRAPAGVPPAVAVPPDAEESRDTSGRRNTV
ncbi:hypothetical protein [Streptomyces sp. AF1A]|jgi:hypothetical protein|uniref:hypothetical protein n=1 Tax=Streptomyces sp. AF1A TaxID=3394350 RepID=UPI0039BCA8D2